MVHFSGAGQWTDKRLKLEKPRIINGEMLKEEHLETYSNFLKNRIIEARVMA